MTTYKFRLLPKKSQISTMEIWLEECRMLYNSFLRERKDGWEQNKKSFTLYDQLNTLPKVKKTFPKLRRVYSQVLQNVGMRIDLAFKAFFRRLKNKETPGYPRFKSYGRYDSFCYPCSTSIETSEEFIHLPKLGNISWIQHREITGKIKTVTVKREHGKWFCFVVTDGILKKKVKPSGAAVGIDVGIQTFATLSDGSTIENPRFFETKQKSLAKAQRLAQKARDEGDKPRIKKTKKVVQTIHRKIKNSRHDFACQTANKLIDEYDTLVVEDINANEMLKKRWCNKQILDAAWGSFLQILTLKAECAGRTILKINPAYTSQTCSKCGTRVLHELKDRVFNCLYCGHNENRDLNASKNILRLGLQSLERGSGDVLSTS